MTCPHDGALRTAIDAEPTEQRTTVRGHVARCASCRDRTAELAGTTAAVVSALAALAPGRTPSTADTEAALTRVRSGMADLPQPSVAAVALLQPGRRDRLRTRLRRPLTSAATVALALSVFATPAGRSAASEFLGHFRSERFAAVTVNERDVNALADLEHLGAVSGNLDAPTPQQVDSLSTAGRRVGFPVAVPDPARLPAGVRRTPQILVSEPRQLRFTFDSEKAAQWVGQRGGRSKALPERFDGTSLVVSVPAAVVLRYDAQDGTPGVLIGQARSIEARAEGGASLDELRGFLLDLPGLSPATRAQLAAIGDWRTTLPLPIPAGQVHWKSTTVAGADGLLLGDNTGLGSAVLWQRDGRIYGVAGPAPAKVIRDVAVSLR